MSSNECAALAEIHNALNPEGGVLPKWTTTVPPGGFVNGSCCDWNFVVTLGHTIGVWCDQTRSTITHMRLRNLPDGYALRGTIPPDAIGQLTGLRGIELGWNPIVGTIPPQLGRLTSLTQIEIQYNSISGTFPSELASLTNLEELAIDYSKLTGLPRNFGSLTGLLGIQCWLEGVQDTCRPNPYPEACSRNSANYPINTLPLCPLYTGTMTNSPPTGTASAATITETFSTSASFTTRSVTMGPTSVPTSTGTAQTPSQAQTPFITRQQRYVIFGSLLSILVSLFLLLSLLHRRLRVREKSVQKPATQPR